MVTWCCVLGGGGTIRPSNTIQISCHDQDNSLNNILRSFGFHLEPKLALINNDVQISLGRETVLPTRTTCIYQHYSILDMVVLYLYL